MEKKTTKEILGATFQEFREQKNVSRYALAQLSGMDSSWLRRFESGKSGIRVETLLILAKALNIPAAQIIDAMEKAVESSSSE